MEAYLKRRNYSHHTLKTYLNKLRQFVLWVDVPLEQVSYDKINAYIDYLMAKKAEARNDQLSFKKYPALLQLSAQ